MKNKQFIANNNLAQILQFYLENQLENCYLDINYNSYEGAESLGKNLLAKKEEEGKKILQITKRINKKNSPKTIANQENSSNVLQNQHQKPIESTTKSSQILPKHQKSNFSTIQNKALINELATELTIGSFSKTSVNSSIAINEIVELARKVASQAQDLEQLKQSIIDFEGCNLKKMATNTVFADGNRASKIMAIGEAPGLNEDLQGIPFCGESGKLLDAMLDSINLNRKENIYISNTVFWRPPGNRPPTSEELAICRPFLEKHIAIIKPKIILLVGATAMNNILGNQYKISNIRGKILYPEFSFLTGKVAVFTIFHPSYLLRQSTKKKVAWQDMLTLEEFIKENCHE